MASVLPTQRQAGMLILAFAAGLFVDPDPGPVLPITASTICASSSL